MGVFWDPPTRSSSPMDQEAHPRNLVGISEGQLRFPSPDDPSGLSDRGLARDGFGGLLGTSESVALDREFLPLGPGLSSFQEPHSTPADFRARKAASI